MTTALLVMTDGRRDCIAKAIPSALVNIRHHEADEFREGLPFDELWIHDDSGDPEYRRWLERFGFETFGPPAGRSGFGGAIRSAWQHLREHSSADLIFHLEDDFTFRRRIGLDAMAHILDTNPHLVQLALRRQPWNEHERAAGGIVEQHPDAYVDTEQHDDSGSFYWLEHRLFFTTNPSLYRRSLIEEHEWPDVRNSEGIFSHHLLGDDRIRFGFLGARDSGEAVEHIGYERVGTGY